MTTTDTRTAPEATTSDRGCPVAPLARQLAEVIRNSPEGCIDPPGFALAQQVCADVATSPLGAAAQLLIVQAAMACVDRQASNYYCDWMTARRAAWHAYRLLTAPLRGDRDLSAIEEAYGWDPDELTAEVDEKADTITLSKAGDVTTIPMSEFAAAVRLCGFEVQKMTPTRNRRAAASDQA